MAKSVSVTAQSWKQHTCVLCGAVYRYKMERKRDSQANNAETARERASQAAQKALQDEYDERACPHCGLVQPEMIGQSKRGKHGCLMALTVLLAIVMAILTLTHAIQYSTILYISLGVSALFALQHLSAALKNPNGNLERNRAGAKIDTERGVTQLIQPGAGASGDFSEVPMSRKGLGVAVLFLLAGVALLPLAEYKRIASGWGYNAQWYPPVIGPGDTSRFYFGQSISTVKGYWSGTATAYATNAAELGLTPAENFTAATRNDGMSTSSGKRSNSSLYLDLTPPGNAAKLEGKTAPLAMDVTVKYKLSSGRETTAKPTVVTPVTFAAPGAGAQYRRLWWWGLMGGFVLQFIAGKMFFSRGSRLMNGLPTQLIPIEESVGVKEED